ncbi:RnfABCDGE type electron transport complex subunit D [Alicyclobacillus dauci]|uniref:RnfABCDGE type electron transport complex subunit D n=1 Tax=Alicyclobacillus dauci TaxID=1475485 RepID=A0ABY6Z5L2_9BACL|nr:RnfABCDGE type electron transport complex subunit D [Alicyclobacillus dauci]WAH37611.1 RnfABCDGE type electron transport complex subunit D [Alicyclobacillus dauci]
MAKHAQKQQRPGGFKKFVGTPKGYVILILVLLMLIGCLHFADARGILNAVIAVATALVIDTFVALLQKRQRLFSDGGVVTALIVALVLSSTVSWYVVVMTTAVAILSKHILKSGRKPWFNPAAFGLLISIYVFPIGESWWGDLSSLPWWAIGILIIVGFLVTSRVNKFPQVFAFMAVYLLIFLGFGELHVASAADAFRNPIINSALFLAFFMMTDPPTSPAKYTQQVGFGVITAIISCGIYLAFGGLSYLLIGLLVANLWKVWIGRKSKAAASPKGAPNPKSRLVREADM